jgi:formate dehydrogenase subunit gamma
MTMMYHSMNVVGALVGGMENVKILHNYGGIFFGVSLLLTILMWWREAGIFSFPEDLQWIMAAGGYLWKVEKMPEVGK